MMKTQIQFPDPLYKRLKAIAARNDWSLAEVVRRATELYADRFPEELDADPGWIFPTVDCGGDFLVDPAKVKPEADAISGRLG